MNGRIQISEADGTFISTFGKPGEAPAISPPEGDRAR